MIVKLKDIQPRTRIVWKKEHVDMAKDVIEDYNPNKGIITISKDYKVLDGNHRHQILCNHYGENHEIEVKQKRFNRSFYVIRFWFLFAFTFPFLIIHTLIKKQLK